jgi:uncharacterized protein (TIGR00304 family)
MSQSTGFKLLLAGFLLIFMGAILASASFFASDNNVSTVAIILIGPIPIIIGSGPYAFFAIFLAAVLTVLCLLLFFLIRQK